MWLSKEIIPSSPPEEAAQARLRDHPDDLQYPSTTGSDTSASSNNSPAGLNEGSLPPARGPVRRSRSDGDNPIRSVGLDNGLEAKIIHVSVNRYHCLKPSRSTDCRGRPGKTQRPSP